MKRLPGVTFSAVLLIVGGSISLLLVLIAIVAVIVAQLSMSADTPKFVLLISIVIDLIALGCAGFAISAGVGLLRLRPWARIFAIVFAALLLFGSVPGLVIVPFMSSFMPQSQSDPELKVFQIAFTVFYGLLTILAGWWLYYFNTRKVKDLFRPRNFPIAPPIVQPLVVPPLVVEPLPTARPAKIKRPVSITVIAAIMLLSVGFAPFALLMLKFISIPFPIFGFWFEGWSVVVITLLYGGAELIAGIGLLKLKLWARTLSICFFLFGIVNGVVSFGIPSSRAHYEKSISDMMSKFYSPITLPGDSKAAFSSISHMTSWSIWVGIVFGLVLAGVQLWFLVKEKPAFIAANQSQPNISRPTQFGTS
ncbi:MAG: hypothetical protein WAM91_12025 [Candidatus Acidiferrales bacterium]